MEKIIDQDVADASANENELDYFGKPPLPWQLRNTWATPKRKRKSRAKPPLDLWKNED